MDVTPFGYELDPAVLADLRRRLQRARFPDRFADAPHYLGTDPAVMRRLVDHWLDGFDWTAQASYLSQVMPGFVTDIGEHRIHFAHRKGPAGAPALLLLHGWPSSFAEMHRIVEPLARHFDLVIPSLPGHGFSSIPRRPGFGADQCADVMRTLMVDVLGYGSFFAHGGDRGAFVGMSLGERHPDVLQRLHLTLCTGIAGEGDERTADEDRFLAEQTQFLAHEGGYSAIQSTRLQSLAVGLHDSPIGLLAWLVEKFTVWSDCNGDVFARVTPDELLTNATLYWSTGTFRASAHWYYEHRVAPPAAMRPVRIEVPTAVARFPREVIRPPRSMVARKFDLRRFTEMPSGGHFASLEEPGLLVDDLVAFLTAQI